MSILFHEIPIGDTFTWRGGTWTKTDQTHAVLLSAGAGANSEHVPSCDTVLMTVEDRASSGDE